MEFDNKSVASSIPHSQGAGQPRKVVLKLNSEQRGVKAFRNLPEDFDGLMGLISKYQKAEVDPSTVKVSYQDDTGDIIGLSDDEDLMTAIEWAETTPTKDLKLQIRVAANQPVKKDPMPVKKETSSIFDKQQVKALKPFSQMNFAEKKAAKMAEQRADTFKQPQTNEQKDSSSSSSESEDAGEQKPVGMIHGAMKVPMPCIDKKDKAKRQQRKMIRKMIRRTMAEHSRDVIQSIVKEDLRKRNAETSSSGAEEAKDSEKNDQQSAEAVHHGYTCDGCEMVPIVGARYKCTVRKDFDYCEACQATKQHPHAFIKITTPAQAPRAMFTIIDENHPGQADIDIDMRQFQEESRLGRPFQNQVGPHGAMGPMFKCGPGMNKQMKNKIGFFMRQMFGDQVMHTNEETPLLANPGNLVARRNPARAVPVNHPTKTFVACPGEEIIIELTFKNGRPKPYKPNFHLESALTEETKAVFAPIKIPLPKTAANETFTVKVPVKILETAETFYQEMSFIVGVTNKNGEEVGYAVPLKVKLVEKMDESALYDKAMQLVAQCGLNLDDEGNFEKAIQTLKEAGYHVDKACAMILADQPTDKADE